MELRVHQISLKDIGDAQKTIHSTIYKTPLIRSSYLSEQTDSEFYLKLENLQVTGSFKIRGAANKLSKISPSLGQKIITASAGNHGQGVALSAQKLGLSAKIVVPKTTPKIKIERIKQYGAEIELYGSIYEEAERYAKEIASKDGLLYVSPYNDEMIIAGQGTVALEILSQEPDVEAVIVPVGGGGLISGVGLAIKSMKSGVEIIGIQSEASPSVYQSFQAGRVVKAKVAETIAEGLSGNLTTDSITFEYLQRYADKMLLVTEDSIRKALRLLWKHDGQVSEGSGAASVAAALENAKLFAKKKVVAIISGGNIDIDRFRQIIDSRP